MLTVHVDKMHPVSGKKMSQDAKDTVEKYVLSLICHWRLVKIDNHRDAS